MKSQNNLSFISLLICFFCISTDLYSQESFDRINYAYKSPEYRIIFDLRIATLIDNKSIESAQDFHIDSIFISFGDQSKAVNYVYKVESDYLDDEDILLLNYEEDEKKSNPLTKEVENRKGAREKAKFTLNQTLEENSTFASPESIPKEVKEVLRDSRKIGKETELNIPSSSLNVHLQVNRDGTIRHLKVPAKSKSIKVENLEFFIREALNRYAQKERDKVVDYIHEKIIAKRPPLKSLFIYYLQILKRPISSFFKDNHKLQEILLKNIIHVFGLDLFMYKGSTAFLEQVHISWAAFIWSAIQHSSVKNKIKYIESNFFFKSTKKNKIPVLELIEFSKNKEFLKGLSKLERPHFWRTFDYTSGGQSILNFYIEAQKVLDSTSYRDVQKVNMYFQSSMTWGNSKLAVAYLDILNNEELSVLLSERSLRLFEHTYLKFAQGLSPELYGSLNGTLQRVSLNMKKIKGRVSLAEGPRSVGALSLSEASKGELSLSSARTKRGKSDSCLESELKSLFFFEDE